MVSEGVNLGYWDVFGCFWKRGCYVCAQWEVVVVDGVKGDFVVFAPPHCAHGLAMSV